MDELEVLAKTIYGEARGERVEGMEAVACVILNRAKVAKDKGGKFWWGNDVKSVCLKPYQFSCWNDNDPNSSLLCKDLTGKLAYDQCLEVAKHALMGILADKTNGATHYHTSYCKPKWAKDKKPCAIIGNHYFYKDI